MASTPVFNSLVQPTTTVTQTPPFNAATATMAWLLGQCTTVVYDQYDNGLAASLDFSLLTALGGASNLTSSNVVQLSASESNGPGATAGDVGEYTTVPAGFAATFTQTTPVSGTPTTFVVIALRGTRTFSEWLEDVDALPAVFDRDLAHLVDGYGSVHAGFLGAYTLGTDGAKSNSPLSSTPSNRATGSLAAQVATYVSGLSQPLPIYVTGHSLGGALASLCAMDIAVNFSKQASPLWMISLASPRVAVGIGSIPTLDNQELFLMNYQQLVPNSFRIVNAADIVPVSPPASMQLGALSYSAAHVTDPWTYNKSSGSALANNVVTFCVQTGSVGGNHSSANVYVPYLQQLAAAFAT